MDTRHLFDRFLNRKACTWEEITEIPWTKITDEMREALTSKPVIFVTSGVGTLDDIFTDDSIIEAIIVRCLTKPEAYYVNNEGYEYCRYTARLPDEIIPMLSFKNEEPSR